MRHRPLDLLPLVDVMMVVLFALVVAQEQDLTVSEAAAAEATGARRALERENEQLRRTLSGSQAGEVAALQAEVERAQRRADQQSQALGEVGAKLRDMTKRTIELQQAQWPSPRDFRRDDVLDKLLDQNSVVEVEITGRPGPGGVPVNHCCFRAGPRVEAWQPCGAVPAVADARRRWLDGGADGLLALLQDTRGGNAVTIIRQDLAATYSVGVELTQTLRARFPDHKLYNDGVQALPVRCDSKEAQ